jgi:hypothetical protein
VKFYKLTAIPPMLHGSKMWALEGEEFRRTEVAEMYLRAVPGYTHNRDTGK